MAALAEVLPVVVGMRPDLIWFVQTNGGYGRLAAINNVSEFLNFG